MNDAEREALLQWVGRLNVAITTIPELQLNAGLRLNLQHSLDVLALALIDAAKGKAKK